MPSRPELDAGLFRMQFVRVRSAADGDEDDIRASRDEPFWRHDVHDRLAFVLPPAARLGLHVDFHAELLEVAGDDAHGVRVRPRQELLHDLRDDDAAPELRIERADFQTGDAAPDDGEVGRGPLEFQRLLRADDHQPIESKRREIRRTAARRDDRVREREVLEAARSPDLQRVRPGEGREARDDVDAVPLAELADAVHEALHDGRFPLLQPDEVHLDRSRLHAAFPGALDRVDEVPGVDEGLARNASVVEALAAEPVALDEEDALPELCGPDRGRIPSGAGANDDDVDLAGHERPNNSALLSLFVVARLGPTDRASYLCNQRDLESQCEEDWPK